MENRKPEIDEMPDTAYIIPHIPQKTQSLIIDSKVTDRFKRNVAAPLPGMGI